MKFGSRKQWLSLGLGALSGLALVSLDPFARDHALPIIFHWATVKERLVSPDSQHTASLIYYSQGALGNHSSWVTVDRSDNPLDPRLSNSIVFLWDTYGESIKWEGPNQLRITYFLDVRRPVRVLQAATSIDRAVSVVYSIETEKDQ